jgi:catechol 2,3-dioxygenase-like lactoylglutathione lyase family enzyme
MNDQGDDRQPRVRAMDHIVLICADVDRTLSWYVDELGLAPVRVDEWRRNEAPFPSARVSPDTIIDFIAGSPTDGRLDHVCLVVEPTDLESLAASGRFQVRAGPVPRFGARGMGTSLYVLDPDGTTVELRHYGGQAQ